MSPQHPPHGPQGAPDGLGAQDSISDQGLGPGGAQRSTEGLEGIGAEELAEALTSGNAVVCYAQCYSCQFGCCHEPPKPHTWMDEEDAEHAGHPWPLPEEVAVKNLCGCGCARGGA